MISTYDYEIVLKLIPANGYAPLVPPTKEHHWFFHDVKTLGGNVDRMYVVWARLKSEKELEAHQ